MKPKKKKTVTKKSLLVVPKKPTPKPRTKLSPVDYYNCLMNYAEKGFYEAGQKQKIHACCKQCKLNAPTLNNQRDKELVKLISSYKQVGDSLAKLLKPLN